MQDFDRLGQLAAGLSAFLTALAHAAPHGWLIDADAAAAGVTLADLSQRLRSGGAGAGPAAARGDCSFF